MKKRKQDGNSGRRALAFLAALVVLGAIVTGTVLAFNKLRALWLEQCVIRDVNAQVEIATGRRIKPDVVRELFDLKEGANLALIDFNAKREEALKRYPVIKSLNISRRLPDGVVIAVTERDPFARIGLKGAKRESGLVCDDEGVVFSCRRGAEMLPILRESDSPGVQPGDRLEGRNRAALEVLKVLHEAEYADLGVLEIDSSKPDFLQFTLTNYTLVKFCWEGMDDFSPASNAALRAQLTKVSQVVATNLQPTTRVWNATQPGIITADINQRN